MNIISGGYSTYVLNITYNNLLLLWLLQWQKIDLCLPVKSSLAMQSSGLNGNAIW